MPSPDRLFIVALEPSGKIPLPAGLFFWEQRIQRVDVSNLGLLIGWLLQSDDTSYESQGAFVRISARRHYGLVSAIEASNDKGRAGQTLENRR